MSPLTDTCLRDLAWTDLAHVARLELQLFAEDAWTEQTWWAELAERPRRDYVVAVDGAGGDGGGVGTVGEVLGYAGLDVAGNTADVMTVATIPAARGRGIGALLLDELVRRATARAAVAMLLEVRADNDPALRLYRRSGFEQIGVRRRYYHPGDVDALVLRRHLPTPADTCDTCDTNNTEDGTDG